MTPIRTADDGLAMPGKVHVQPRKIVRRTRGNQHGPITRLMSPSSCRSDQAGFSPSPEHMWSHVLQCGLMSERRIGIRELKSKLSECVREVRAGRGDILSGDDSNEGDFGDGAWVQEVINAVDVSFRERRWVSLPL